MKLYILTLADGTEQEVIANNAGQAFECARSEVIGYTATDNWTLLD